MTILDVDFRHPDYVRYAPEWELVADCVAGERQIKYRKMRYLPHPSADHATSDPAGTRYSAYLNRAAFVNATGRTLAGLLGIAFSKPVSVELSGALAPLRDDVDGLGQPLTQLMRDALSQTLQCGRAGILTDYTGTGIQTINTAGRPTLKLYTAHQIRNWRVVNGKTTLLVVHETEAEDLPDQFRFELVEKWTELRLIEGLAFARVWKRNAKGFAGSELVPLRNGDGTQRDELPWAWIGSTNNDARPDAPPLSDIAFLNIKHYQAEADISEIAHLTGNPTATVSGLTHEWADKFLVGGIAVGSSKGIVLPEGGKLEMVQAADRNLPITVAERRERQMAMLGAKLVERGAGAKTATQAQDEAQTDNSILSLCAGNVESAINRALIHAAEYAGGAGTVELNKRYEVAQLDSQAITALLAAVQSGKLLMIDFIRYLQGIGIADPNVSAEEIEDQLRNQSDLGELTNAPTTAPQQQAAPEDGQSAPTE